MRGKKLRKRRKSGLARVGILTLVLVMAMGVMGVSYSLWADEILLVANTQTGYLDSSLACDGYGTEPSGGGGTDLSWMPLPGTRATAA